MKTSFGMVLGVLALTGVSTAMAQEADRGTVRKPDYVAIPHAEGRSEAYAGSEGEVKVGFFSQYDSNGDGIVSPNEWRDSVEDFQRLDANDDNCLSPRELASYAQISDVE